METDHEVISFLCTGAQPTTDWTLGWNWTRGISHTQEHWQRSVKFFYYYFDDETGNYFLRSGTFLATKFHT